MAGQRGRQRRTAWVTPTVIRATAKAAGCHCPACAHKPWTTAQAEPPTAKPITAGSACTMMSTAAPEVKPKSTDGEIKSASMPRRKAPINHCRRPTITVTASASCT